MSFEYMQPGDIVARYLENEKEITRISSETNQRIETISETSKVRIHNIQETIDELNNEIYDIHKESERNKREAELEKDALIEPLYDYIQWVNRVVIMLKISESDNIAADILVTDVSTYNNRDFVWLDYLYNDDFLKIRLLAVENDKPKNRYSLMAYGRSIFMNAELMEKCYHYGWVNIRDCEDHRPSFNIRTKIISLPSIEDIKKYVSKHKIMQDTISQHNRLKMEYDSVIKNYKLSDFKDIIDNQKEGK